MYLCILPVCQRVQNLVSRLQLLHLYRSSSLIVYFKVTVKLLDSDCFPFFRLFCQIVRYVHVVRDVLYEENGNKFFFVAFPRFLLDQLIFLNTLLILLTCFLFGELIFWGVMIDFKFGIK